jgi:hypothetical protein
MTKTPNRNPARHRLGNGRQGGWQPDRPKAEQDWRLSQVLGPATRKAIKNPSLNPAYFPLMKNQGNLGSCTGESLALAVEYCVIEERAVAGENVQSNWWKTWGLSGLAAYYFAREIDKTIYVDAGSQIRSAIDGARKHGIPTEALWPYKPSKFTEKPDAKAMKTAPWHKLDNLKTYRCDEIGRTREQTVTNILRALEAGMPVNFGFSCPADWGSYDENGVIPVPNGQYDGGHAMTALMADTASRMLIGPNTWGDDHAGQQPNGSRVISDGGRGWFAISFDYFLSGDGDDAWAVALK